MKNNKGITLIALVVTIIVLLILAGISIAMLTGDNGIITNTQTAKKNTLQSGAKESILIALNSMKTEVLAQVNTVSTYDPTSTTGSANTKLIDDKITGLTNKGLPINTEEEGYYIQEATSASKVVTITYVNPKNNFKVVGTLTFGDDFKNGGTVAVNDPVPINN